MQKHIKVYTKYYGIGPQDISLCEVCGAVAVDIHHIIHRSQGGSDEIENLIGLCRSCHEKAHKGELGVDFLKQKHAEKM